MSKTGKKFYFFIIAFQIVALCTYAQNKVFKYNQTGGLTSLDPAFANKRSNIWVVSQIYNGLFRFDNKLMVQPDLVEKWHISEDGLTYTFQIKQGIKFQDNKIFPQNTGRELKATDFVYSFNRILDYKTGSTGSWIFKDKVIRDKNGIISDTCFKETGDYTFKIYLKKKFPSFLELLATPYTFVIPKEAVEYYQGDFRSNPVGTGPFMLKEWTENKLLILSKNKDYWKSDSVNTPLPYLDEIQVKFEEDRNKEYFSFLNGELDFVTNISELSRDQVLNTDGSIKNVFLKYFQVETTPYLNTEYIGFFLEGNEKENPFVNKKLRLAMSYAVNKKELVHSLRKGLGYVATSGFVPPSIPDYDTNRVTGHSYNLKKAKELLKEAGYPFGKGLPELVLNTYPHDKELAEFLKKEWEGIGLKIKIEMNQFSFHQMKVDNSKVNLFRGSWLGDYPDAENFLSLFYSKNASPVGPNKTHFKDAEFDRLFEEAHEVSDMKTIYEDYYNMDNIIIREAAVIPLYYDEVIWMLQKHVRGLEINAMNNLYLETVSLDVK